jgi:5'-deoxynucleotidase YfbR-like HD superfamily hydrolase
MTIESFYQVEQFDINTLPLMESSAVARTILDISQVTIDFANIERVPRYNQHRRENNAEHSFMLGLAGVSVAEQHFPELDSGLVTKFALVHDLVELETMDIPTFNASEATLSAKEAAEKQALEVLGAKLNPVLMSYLERYEEQEELEARLVRHIDKLLPYSVDINGAGVQVMIEDYNTRSVDELMQNNEKLEERFHRMFPELSHTALHGAHTILANKFALEFPEA